MPLTPDLCERLLCISSRHITRDDMDILDSGDGALESYYKGAVGWFVRVPDTDEADLSEYSAEFVGILRWADQNDCTWIELDANGPIHAGLPTFDWASEDLWTEEHRQHASAQGWGVFAIDGDEDMLEIQRLDEADIFDSDEDAYAFVIDMARKDDQVALLALQLCPPF